MPYGESDPLVLSAILLTRSPEPDTMTLFEDAELVDNGAHAKMVRFGEPYGMLPVFPLSFHWPDLFSLLPCLHGGWSDSVKKSCVLR